MALIAFKSRLFPVQPIKGTCFNILTTKQIIQRLPIALAQAKAGNTSKNLSNNLLLVWSK